MAVEASRYLFHWMPAAWASRALASDAIAPSWVHFISAAGRLASGVRLAATFSRDIGNAWARGGAVLVFDRWALPPGGHDLDGRAAYELTLRVLAVRSAGDGKALRETVRAERDRAPGWSGEPDEHFLPFDVQPSRHGLVAVGLLQPLGPVSEADAVRAAADRLGIPCAEAATAADIASALGRAIRERRRSAEPANATRPDRRGATSAARPRDGDVYEAISSYGFGSKPQDVPRQGREIQGETRQGSGSAGVGRGREASGGSGPPQPPAVPLGTARTTEMEHPARGR